MAIRKQADQKTWLPRSTVVIRVCEGNKKAQNRNDSKAERQEAVMAKNRGSEIQGRPKAPEFLQIRGQAK
jgi:hypothetical protein